VISLKWRLSAFYQRDAGKIQLVKALLKDNTREQRRSGREGAMKTL